MQLLSHLFHEFHGLSSALVTFLVASSMIAVFIFFALFKADFFDSGD